MKTYIVYVNGREVAIITSPSYNEAAEKAKQAFGDNATVGVGVGVTVTEEF